MLREADGELIRARTVAPWRRYVPALDKRVPGAAARRDRVTVLLDAHAAVLASLHRARAVRADLASMAPLNGATGDDAGLLDGVRFQRSAAMRRAGPTFGGRGRGRDGTRAARVAPPGPLPPPPLEPSA